MGGIMPQELIDKRIKELAEKCRRLTEEHGIYIINSDDFEHIARLNYMKKVVALIEADGKYICHFQQSSIVFETRHNPNYDINESVKKTNSAIVQNIEIQEKYANRTLAALWLTVILSFIGSGISIYEIIDNKVELQLSRQVESLKKIDSTLSRLVEKAEKAKEDTLNVSLINGLSSKTNQPNSK